MLEAALLYCVNLLWMQPVCVPAPIHAPRCLTSLCCLGMQPAV